MNWRYLGLFAVVPLLLSGAAVAFTPPSFAPSPLNLSLAGGINSVSSQNYILSQHGQADYASVQGQVLDPASLHVDYSLSAVVTGPGESVHGAASLHLTGVTSHGQKVLLQGKITILGIVVAEGFSDGSAIPAAFTGVFTGYIGVGENVVRVSLPIALESPFINPFGAPIVVASLDSAGSIVLVTGYQVGKIIYSHVQVLGESAGGSVGSIPITTGEGVLTTFAVEDLHSGIEFELGTIGFAGMTPSLLDSNGFYFGTSIIPGTNECLSTYGFSPCTFDCTPELETSLGLSVPYSTGLCTITGFISSGTFFSHGPQALIFGRYVTVWDIPAISFGMTIPPPFGGSTITGEVITI
jgi:hypothetical protein